MMPFEVAEAHRFQLVELDLDELNSRQ